MPWSIDNIGDILKAAACAPGEGPQLRHETLSVEDKPKGYGKGKGKNKPAPPAELNVFGANKPGQLWFHYKSKHNEKPEEARLDPKLRHPPTPSTSAEQFQRQHAAWQQENPHCMNAGYLKFNQKQLNPDEWYQNPDNKSVHGGAHFPLAVWTNTSSARSKESYEKRIFTHPFRK